MLDNSAIPKLSKMRINMFIRKTTTHSLYWVEILPAALNTALAAWRFGLTALLMGVLLSSGGCAWLDTKQRNIIYRPTPGVPADFAGLRTGDERYFLTQPAASPATSQPVGTLTAAMPEQVEIWWLPHTNPSAPALLYYHGTFRNLYQNLNKINALRDAGFAVLAVDYRGWGRSTPIVPSEQTILQDAQLAWDEFKRKQPNPTQRVIYGHSMGSGVAVDMASRLKAPADYAAIILESAFTTFPDIAAEANFLGRLASGFNNERFASIDKIAKVQAPLLMMHGSLDTTVPLVLGQKLFAAANTPKEWFTVEGGGHSDLHQVGAAHYQNTVLSFKNKYVLGR
jgi:uncharacterized protein